MSEAPIINRFLRLRKEVEQIYFLRGGKEETVGNREKEIVQANIHKQKMSSVFKIANINLYI